MISSRSPVYPHAERYVASWLFTLGIVFALACLVLSGCSVTDSYVVSDRKVYDIIGPAYSAYVQADARLTKSEKARKLRLVVAWDARITQGEKP